KTMTAYRAWTSLVGVLCLTGSALAQTQYLEATDPYGLRLTRLDNQPQPLLSYGGIPNGGVPVSGMPIAAHRARAPATVAAPQPPTPATTAPGSVPPAGSYENALNSSGSGDDCGCQIPSCCCNTHWYAYVGGLTMGRTTANKFYTTFDQTNPANQLRYFPGSD